MTGCSNVSLLVPSTVALKSVSRSRGWPPRATVKSGVEVLPSTSIFSSTPPNFPLDERMPLMPFEVSQVGFVEGVLGCQRCLARMAFQAPRPKTPLGLDFARRHGIGKLRGERGGAVEPDPMR